MEKASSLYAQLKFSLVLIWIFWASTLKSQTGFLNEIPQTQLSPSQATQLQKILSGPNVSEFSIITIGDLSASSSSGVITFTLPGFSIQPISVTKMRSEYVDEDNYTWTGTINGQGDVFLGAKYGGNIGFININDSYYFLHPLGDKKCVLTKQINNTFPPAECGTNSSESMLSSWNCDNTSCSSTTDVLILVSTEANLWMTNTFGIWKILYLWLGTEAMNISLAGSGVPNTFIRPNYLFDVSFPYSFTIPNVPVYISADELTFYTNESWDGQWTGFKDQVNQWRTDFGADLVVYLTNRGYGIAGAPPGSQVFGAARNVPDFPSANSSYQAIVEVPYLFAPHYAMAHELSHLFGCNHRFIEPHKCPNAYNFTDASGFEFKTLVSSGSENGTRILRYSNPDVNYNSVPTGIISTNEIADNARQMRNASCDVSEYQPANFDVKVIGRRNKCVRGYHEGFLYKAKIEVTGLNPPVLPPYSYQWQVSPNSNSTPFIDIPNETSDQI